MRLLPFGLIKSDTNAVSVCEIFDPEPLEVETKKGFGHLPDHIKAVMNLNTSDAYMFSSTVVYAISIFWTSLISFSGTLDVKYEQP